jgi:pimeloyl-ACP methyl ester carboxylesterase
MICRQVTTEGDTLYLEIRGDGAPLLFIPGGGGDGATYSAVADRLSDEFKVITYDRRANGRSTINFPDRFDIQQESRDAVAVLGAAGESSAFVAGNSSGAVIALDMAATQPRAVKGVIAHEPPLARIHPDSAKWQAFFRNVVRTRRHFGLTLAMIRFSFGIGVVFDAKIIRAKAMVAEAKRARKSSAVPYLSRRKILDHFVDRELLAVTNYEPNVNALRAMRDRIVLAAGRISLANTRFYAEVAPILAREVGCEMAQFPGYHASFADTPDEWAATLRGILNRLKNEAD